MKESNKHIERGAIFYQPFLSEQDVLASGGVSTSVTYTNGSSVYNGASSKVTFAQDLYGVQSVQLDLTLTTTTEDILKLSSTHSIEAGSGTVTATGFTAPTIYVDGVATTTITAGAHQIIVTTATAFTSDDIQYGTVTGFLEGSIDLSVIYNTALSASEAENLYYKKRHRALIPTGDLSELLDISAQSGSLPGTDRWGNIITPALVTIYKDSVYSFLFNGSSSKIDAGAANPLLGDVTVMFRIKPYGVGGSGAGRPIDNGELFCFLNSNGSISFRSNGATSATSGTNAWSVNNWSHLAITRTAAGVTNIYVDAVLSGAADQSSGTPVTASSNLFLGNNLAAASAIDGMLNDIKIYSGLFSVAQISQAYTESKGGYLL